jgi:hypothetical protein
MSYFLFIDESGHDRRESPYEVLAGVAIHDEDLWNLIKVLHDAEIKHFGCRYTKGTSELKAKKLLNRRVFQQASLNADFDRVDIPNLARFALEHGDQADIRHIKALAIAKLNYVTDVFETCSRFRCKAFASIVETDAVNSVGGGLRKDYGYLFERFFYFLEDKKFHEQGIIVFDELEKSRSHVLIEQAHTYFKETATGRRRSSLIIPEPFFVHSDLTTGVQLADLIAYVISWGVRIKPQMAKPAREELLPYSQQVSALRYCATRERNGSADFSIWSFAYISDLRTKSERDEE